MSPTSAANPLSDAATGTRSTPAGPSRAGVIGWPLGHSISPSFQQAAFDALGLPVTYVAVPVAPTDLERFTVRLRDATDGPPWLGVNVTIPHKEAIARLVDDVTLEARQIGAVNTVIVHGATLLGHNTDAQGFLGGLQEAGVDPAAMPSLLVGAGGAARAVAVALLRSGVTDLAISNRSPARAEALCVAMRQAFPHATIMPVPQGVDFLLEATSRATLVVNATSVGMSRGPAPDESPLPEGAIRREHVVYDLVYNPQVTPLLQESGDVGATVVEGLPMLVHQGAASLERWTGCEAPLAVMRAAAERALAAMRAGG